MPSLRLSTAALACSLVLACGGGRSATAPQCAHDRDCPVGQGCVNSLCAPLPCAGACQPDQACGNDGKCAPAQGATCADHTCPAGYPCNGASCAKGCTLNSDCDPGSVCNSQLHSCAQCTFNNDCAGVAGKTRCDSLTGVCVACQANIDCTTAVGPDHICANHACVPGCQADADCNAGTGERCDGATPTSPGRCIQCKSKNDCGVGAPACDETGHCVGCFGASQAEANGFCGPGSPECDLPSKTCVACLTANNASGLDCGYQGTTPPDPHFAQTCNAATHSCVPGCASDAQCGCPRTAAGGAESNSCGRLPDQEHCDPARTTMNGAPSLGACVQCRPKLNADCAYKVRGTTEYNGAYATFNGARCVSDTCVEGCDTSADCPGNRICHLGGPGDANNHKCVECACDSPGADPTWCDAAVCQAKGDVCDVSSLLCRRKRQSEKCLASAECGDASDPTIGACVPSTGFCLYTARPNDPQQPQTSCSPSQAFGRCAIACDDLGANRCVGGTPCPSLSVCETATNEGNTKSPPPSGTYCVPNSCH